jgi:PAS domain S-box-containing protein
MSLVKPESALLTLIDLDPRACFILDLESKAMAYANPAFYTYFQLKQDGLKTDRLQKMINKEDRSRVEKVCCTLEPGQLQQVEFGLKLTNGSMHVVEITVTLNQQGSSRLVTGFLKDITLERTMEAEDKEKKEARELRRRTLRHDLAGTLGFIPTFTHLLLKKSESLEDPQIPVLLSSIESISKETLAKVKEYMSEETS